MDTNLFPLLSDELILFILSNNSIFDLANVAKVDQRFHRLAMDKHLSLFAIKEAYIDQKVREWNKELNCKITTLFETSQTKPLYLETIVKIKELIKNIAQSHRCYDIDYKALELLLNYRINFKLEWCEAAIRDLLNYFLKTGIDVEKQYVYQTGDKTHTESLLSDAEKNKNEYPLIYEIIRACSNTHRTELKSQIKF